MALTWLSMSLPSSRMSSMPSWHERQPFSWAMAAETFSGTAAPAGAWPVISSMAAATINILNMMPPLGCQTIRKSTRTRRKFRALAKGSQPFGKGPPDRGCWAVFRNYSKEKEGPRG